MFVIDESVFNVCVWEIWGIVFIVSMLMFLFESFFIKVGFWVG